LWQGRLQWDEQLSITLQQAWNLYCAIPNLSAIQIHRKEVERDNNIALLPKRALFEAFGSCHEGMFCLK
jgi:hypothetical protein